MASQATPSVDSACLESVTPRAGSRLASSFARVRQLLGAAKQVPHAETCRCRPCIDNRSRQMRIVFWSTRELRPG